MTTKQEDDFLSVQIPESWYYVTSSKKLAASFKKPFSFTIGNREFVAYRAASGKAVVLDGRCRHLGARLKYGQVRNDCVVCPLHGWHYNVEGHCQHIPAGCSIPAWAKIKNYPVEERFGHVYFFLGSEASFPLPNFLECENSEFLPASIISFNVRCSWYMIGANAFDGQHYRFSHDRAPVTEPEVSSPSEYVLKIKLQLKILNASIRDRLIKAIAGPVVDFSVTNYGGTMLLVTSKLKNTFTCGFLNIIPRDEQSCTVVNIVLIKKSRSIIKRLCVDPINSVIRRALIKEFMSAEHQSLTGISSSANKCTDMDKEMKQYLQWITALCNKNAKQEKKAA